MDVWDWLCGLRRWWWMLVAFPGLALTMSLWFAPTALLETTWRINVYSDDPELVNAPGYFDYIFLDDFEMLLRTDVLGDLIYMDLPSEVREFLSREQFGDMLSSERKANFVQITVSGTDAEVIRIVADTIDANLPDIANTYLLPPGYASGPLTINRLDEIDSPGLSQQPRIIFVCAITVATLLVSIAATGVAEWLRLSYRAKYSVR